MGWTIFIVIVAAVASALTLIAWLGRRADERRAEADRAAEAKRKEIEADVKKRPDDQLDRDISRWMRD